MRSQVRVNTAAAGLLVLLLATSVNAQLTDLPDLSTATQKTSSSSSSSAKSTSTSATSTSSASSASSATTTTGSATSTTGTATGSLFSLTAAPTVAGAGIPTMIVPYTADAPFMQKSSLPEGTVFIVVGAVLGFLGFCVLAWRALVAYSINKSVKKAALASVMASDTKSTGGWMSNPLGKPSRGFYSHAPDGSSLSLDHLTSSGKPMAKSRASHVPPPNPSGLFFSPTASAAPASAPMAGLPGARQSSYLPAGYYASPSAQAAGGAGSTTLGSTLNPNNQRRSRSVDPSPPVSPAAYDRKSTRLSANPAGPGLQLPNSRDTSRGPSRPTSTLLPPTHGLHGQASSSSLGVNTGHGEDLPGSRAPSAYLEDLFETHGNGSREAF